jgi:type II secretory pathway pseudopilin PulG
MRKNRSAITFSEVCVAIAIIVVLCLVVFPVVSGARKSAYKSRSVTNLRQIGVALELYKQQAEDYPLRYFDPLVESGLLRDRSLLRSKCDVLPGGYGYEMALCADGGKVPKFPSSFETILFDQATYSRLISLDASAAIVVDRTCGQRMPSAIGCDQMLRMYWGSIARLHPDTSVKIGRFWFDTVETGTSWRRLRLYTEKELPPVQLPPRPAPRR